MGRILRALGFSGPVVDHAIAAAGQAEAKFDAIGVDDLPGIFAELTGTSYTALVGIAPKVDRKIALSVPAVSRSRDRIAGTIGTLPLDLIHEDSKETLSSELLEQPEMGLARVITITRTVADLMFENVALWLVKERDGFGFPTYVERIDTCRFDRDPRTGVIRVDGKEVPNIDVILFVGPAEDGALVRGARAIRQAVLLDDLARRFAENPQPREYFVPAEGADPANEDVTAVLNSWKTARQTGVTGYVGGGLELKSGQLISPRDLQLTDARQHAVLEIARLFGIDPDDLGVSVTSRTYQNLEQSRREFITNTLQPFISAVEQRLSLADVSPRGTEVRFNLSAFLRADTTSRYASYTAALAGKFLTVDEVRALEDRQPIDKAEEAAVTNSAGTVASGKFSDPEIVTFDAPAAAASFKVDLDKRTITGLAVPYGVVASSGGRKWQFSKGSLTWDDVSRVKFLDGHDWGKPIGRAIELNDTDAGLVPVFKIVNTPAGDEALLMASEQVKDGLSIGIALGGTFDERDGVLHAVSAPLAEISLTPCPAFDSARVTAVAASKQTNEEHTMTDKVETPATEPVAPQFSADQVAALQALLGKPAEPVKPEPQPVPAFSVKEEAPYRFDGSRGAHEFSNDVFASIRSNDGEAKARLDKFMAAAFDVTTTNVASVNPSRQRPDLFVDQLGFTLPVWDAISKGTLADSTPFIVPKYSTSSGLVADHTQGTEPTEGSYSTTSQTITPGAISGKVEITREVVDAGGNPQVSGLIWNQVVRDYGEALEAKAVALLDGLTPSAIALTTAAADDVLAGQIEAAFAALHFTRGGDRFDKLVLQEDLYKAIVAARDADGRVLYPVLGAVNANGQTALDFGSVRIGGKTGLPAWALGASGTVSESSYLFSSDDVHGWATAPQQLRFEYQVATVTIGVWGYQATANTRLAGVREITYDPAA